MEGYVERLMLCGAAITEAWHVCRSIVRDFSVWELDVYVRTVEQRTYGG